MANELSSPHGSPESEAMQFENIMLTCLLNHALAATVFRTAEGKVVTIKELQSAFSGLGGRTKATLTTLTAHPEVEDEQLKDLVEYLADHLQQYLSDSGRMIGYPGVWVGHESVQIGAHEVHALADGYRVSAINHCSSLHYFAKTLLHACARVGVKQVVEQFDEWVAGRSRQFKICAVLHGIHIKNKINLMEGITLYELPTRSRDLPNSIPQARKYMIMNILGKTVIEIQGCATPNFFKPSLTDNDTYAVSSKTALGEISLDLVMMSLSLTANHPVHCTKMWSQQCETVPFEDERMQRMVEPHSTPRGEIRSISYDADKTVTKVDFVRGADLSEDDIRSAWARIPSIVGIMESKPRFGVAVNRWVEAVSHDTQSIYRLIDLRIALEALYIDSEQGELSHRLALTGAKHLGATLDDRKLIQRTLKDFYQSSSKAIHGGTATLDKDKVEETTKLCRDGIMKIIETGKIPAWNEILLR